MVLSARLKHALQTLTLLILQFTLNICIGGSVAKIGNVVKII